VALGAKATAAPKGVSADQKQCYRLHSKWTNPTDAQEGQGLQSSLGNGLQNIQGKQP